MGLFRTLEGPKKPLYADISEVPELQPNLKMNRGNPAEESLMACQSFNEKRGEERQKSSMIKRGDSGTSIERISMG